ncbi:MAG TPA: hypothetical protein VMU75_13830 [Acidimicrobiales bacterium]|nr:hypothetical protein [Acidimicrobiales bacterium]
MLLRSFLSLSIPSMGPRQRVRAGPVHREVAWRRADRGAALAAEHSRLERRARFGPGGATALRYERGRSRSAGPTW